MSLLHHFFAKAHSDFIQWRRCISKLPELENFTEFVQSKSQLCIITCVMQPVETITPGKKCSSGLEQPVGATHSPATYSPLIAYGNDGSTLPNPHGTKISHSAAHISVFGERRREQTTLDSHVVTLLNALLEGIHGTSVL